MPPENSATSRFKSAGLNPKPNSSDFGAAFGGIEIVALQFAQNFAQLGQGGVVTRSAAVLRQYQFEFQPAFIAHANLAQGGKRLINQRTPADLR